MKKDKITNELKNKSILVTGGAGSIGSILVSKLLEYPIKSIRVLDIDEHALFKLNKKLNDSRLRILLGSILDQDRVDMAVDGIDKGLLCFNSSSQISKTFPLVSITFPNLTMQNLVELELAFID